LRETRGDGLQPHAKRGIGDARRTPAHPARSQFRAADWSEYCASPRTASLADRGDRRSR